MADPGDIIAIVTDDLAEPHREAMVRDFYGRICMRLDLQPLERGSLRINARTTVLAGMTATRGSVAPMAWERRGDLMDDAGDDIAVSWISGGWRFARPGRDDLETAPGSACVMQFDRRWRAEARNGDWTVCFQVSRTLLTPLVPHLDDVEPDAIRADSAEARLLFNYVQAVTREPVAPKLATLAARHIADLLAAALGTTAEGSRIVEDRGVRAARLRAIRQFVEEHLPSSRLSAETVARRFGLSPRYIRALFAAEGRSFSDYVRERRLARIYHRLTDPRFAAMPIASLAFEEGLVEPSTFYRQFKARYGMRPSDVREQFSDR